METKPNPFDDLVLHLQHSLLESVPPPSHDPADPALGSYLDAQVLAQQCALVQHFEMKLSVDLTDDHAANNLQRSLTQVERIRSRVLRARQFDARHELEQLKQLEGSSQPDRHEARAFLEAELARGERPAKELFAIAQSMGISPRTLKRAKSDLTINSELRHGLNQPHAWIWSLPASASPSPSASPSVLSSPPPAISA